MANIELINRDILPPTVLDELDNLVTQLNAYLTVATASNAALVSTSATGLSVGMMMIWPSAALPTHWLLCDGTAISRVTYQALFQVIGTTFGAGDGVTTFNLPDMRQRFPLGVAQSGTGSVLGGNGGNIDHTHSVTTGVPSTTTANVAVTGATTVASATHTHSATTGTANPPFVALNYIILTQ